MRKLIQLFLALITLPVIQSCVSDIELDDESEMPLVVHCVLNRPDRFWNIMDDSIFGADLTESQQPVQYLDLYRAKKTYETQMQKIDDAIVYVTDPRGNKHYFQWNGERWQCRFLPQYGGKYTLDVTTAENHRLKAETVFPPRAKLYTTALEKASTGYFGGLTSRARYYYVETVVARYEPVAPNVTNVYFDQALYKGSYNLWVTAHSRSYNSSLEADLVPSVITNHPGADAFNICKGVWRESRISQYENNDFQYILGRTDLDVPPSDIDFWNLYDSECAKSPYHNKFVRIRQDASMPCAFAEGVNCYKSWKNENVIDSRLLFVLNADFNPENNNFFTARFVSDEYDRYLRDVADKYDVHGDEFASYYSMEPVYSNIEGGIGIFGGICEFKHAYGK